MRDRNELIYILKIEEKKGKDVRKICNVGVVRGEEGTGGLDSQKLPETSFASDKKVSIQLRKKKRGCINPLTVLVGFGGQFRFGIGERPGAKRRSKMGRRRWVTRNRSPRWRDPLSASTKSRDPNFKATLFWEKGGKTISSMVNRYLRSGLFFPFHG